MRFKNQFLVVSLAGTLHAQSAFQNLEFESANIQQTQPHGFVNTTDALPGWSVYLGSSQQSQVQYNNPSLGSTRVSLLGTNGSFNSKSIEGGFSVFLQGGVTETDASIRQTSLVPVFAESILFKAKPGSESLLLVVVRPKLERSVRSKLE